MAREVILSSGSICLVSDEDYEKVILAGRWYEDTGHGRRSYARRKVYFNSVYKTTYMHNFILGSTPGLDTDHINGNGLDNRRENLRKVSRGLNNLNNDQPRSNNTSGFRGIWYDYCNKRWKAEIKIDGKKFNLGSFSNPEDAHKARLIAVERFKQGLPVK